MQNVLRRSTRFCVGLFTYLVIELIIIRRAKTSVGITRRREIKDGYFEFTGISQYFYRHTCNHLVWHSFATLFSVVRVSTYCCSSWLWQISVGITRRREIKEVQRSQLLLSMSALTEYSSSMQELSHAALYCYLFRHSISFPQMLVVQREYVG
jgi:hypothetical protein